VRVKYPVPIKNPGAREHRSPRDARVFSDWSRSPGR
jgi:hypothetical protein